MKANKAGRINFKFTNAGNAIKKLQLYKEGKLLNAAEVLFCSQNKLEQQMAVFAGTDKTTFLDIQLYKGTIFDLLIRSMSYIKEHINWRAELTEEGRKEIPEVPLRALTEALVNSFCHRDYFRPEGNKAAIFKDRIEIYNPGAFPQNKTPEDFIEKEEESILRNPTLAHNLYLSEEIEKWGSGIRRIYNECKENKIKVEFLRMSDGFKVIFYRREETPQISPQISPQKATKLEEKILVLIKKDKTISRKDIAKKMKFSEDTIKEYLNRLKKKNLLIRVGPDRGGYWEIVEINKKHKVESEKIQ